MKLGLLTAAFPGEDLEHVAAWAASERFAALEIACWPADAGAQRRYGGVCHVDCAALDAAGARRVRALLDEHGLELSALAYYPNVLASDPQEAHAAREHLRHVIAAAALLEVDVVGTFVGRDPSLPLSRTLEQVAEVWPGLIRHAREHGVRIAIENCPMIFGEDEWPGGTNAAYSPALWRQLFEIVDDPGFGLNLDPSHLIWQMIDAERVVREFAQRIFHVHAKDLEIDRDGLYEHGVMSAGMGWQIPRLPGLGEVRWDRFLAALYAAGYDGAISVEHEDRQFEGDPQLVRRGFLLARNVLEPYLP